MVLNDIKNLLIIRQYILLCKIQYERFNTIKGKKMDGKYVMDYLQNYFKFSNVSHAMRAYIFTKSFSS